MAANGPAIAQQQRRAAIRLWRALPAAVQKEIIERAKWDLPADPPYQSLAAEWGSAASEPSPRWVVGVEVWVVACAVAGVGLAIYGTDVGSWLIAAVIAPVFAAVAVSARDRHAPMVGAANLRAMARDEAADQPPSPGLPDRLVVASRPVAAAMAWLPVIPVAVVAYFLAAATLHAAHRGGSAGGLASAAAVAFGYCLPFMFPVLRRLDPRVVRRPRKATPMLVVEAAQLGLPCFGLTVNWSQVAAIEIEPFQPTHRDGIVVAIRLHGASSADKASGYGEGHLAAMLRRHGAVRFAVRDLDVDPLLLLATVRHHLTAPVVRP